ncbi:MAG: hypothetical protein ACLU7P_00970 [Eggerthella lenta]
MSATASVALPLQLHQHRAQLLSRIWINVKAIGGFGSDETADRRIGAFTTLIAMRTERFSADGTGDKPLSSAAVTRAEPAQEHVAETLPR